jgi:hypothetical protein
VAVNRDFVDLLAAFCAEDVEFLVVGAHALAAHGPVRATNDLDLGVRPSPENAPRVLRAVASFGAPLEDLTEADLVLSGLEFQIGVPALRIGVITAIDGVEFEEASPERLVAHLGEVAVPVLSRRHLIANKRTSGRHRDLADLERPEGEEP